MIHSPLYFRSIIGVIVYGLITGCATWQGPDPDVSAKPKLNSGSKRSYVVHGTRYYLINNAKGFHEKGLASWYGSKFHGKKTASQEPYNMNAMTAAHKTLPFQTIVRVLNLENNRKTTVRINDRGPFVKGRIIDLSFAAAKKLKLIKKGVARVRIEVISDPQSQRSDLPATWKAVSSAGSQKNDSHIKTGT